MFYEQGSGEISTGLDRKWFAAKKNLAPPALCILDAAAGFISAALKYLCTITQTALPLSIAAACHSEEKPFCR